jgi:hypothetical protein
MYLECVQFCGFQEKARKGKIDVLSSVKIFGIIKQMLSLSGISEINKAKNNMILGHINPVLGNDRTKQLCNISYDSNRTQHLYYNRGIVFSVHSVPRCYKLDELRSGGITGLPCS